MDKNRGDKAPTLRKPGHGGFSRRWVLALAVALVVVLALVIGLNVGGLREEILWRINPPRIESIAVLPLKNLSHDPGQDNLAAAMTVALTDDLQRMEAIRVVAGQSVAPYRKAPKPPPEIGQELNIDAVVKGGVLRSGDRVRLAADLIHAPTNRRLWGRTLERDLSEVLRLSADISSALTLEITGKLAPQQEASLSGLRAVNPQAYEAYMESFSGDPANREASLKRAVELDPMFARAYDMTAGMYYMRNMFTEAGYVLPPRDAFPAAREAAQKAVSLDPTLSPSHRILGSVALEYDWDFVAAEKEFKRAIELAPNGPVAHHMYAHFLLSMGRMEEARAESRHAMDVDPRRRTLIACVSFHDIAEGSYDEAEKHALQALSLGVPDQLARLTLGWSYALRGRHDEAIAEFQKAVVGWQNAVFPTAALGHAYAVAGQEPAAREVLDKLIVRSKNEYVSPYEIAVIYAGLGDKDRAFEWLEKALGERSTMLVYFRMDPRIWSLRSDARFQDLLRRMNFPQKQ